LAAAYLAKAAEPDPSSSPTTSWCCRGPLDSAGSGKRTSALATTPEWDCNINPPIPPWGNGSADSLEQAKAEFRAAWERLYATLTPGKIGHWHHHQDAAKRLGIRIRCAAVAVRCRATGGSARLPCGVDAWLAKGRRYPGAPMMRLWLVAALSLSSVAPYPHKRRRRSPSHRQMPT
jgi:hypothetical protein